MDTKEGNKRIFEELISHEEEITIIAAIGILFIANTVFAESLGDLIRAYVPVLDWFSLEEAEKAEVPERLTEREAEIYRAGFADGHYSALHPDYVPGTYVINTKTKKFHLTNCNTTLTIDSKNREHTTKKPEELIAQGYKPCGQCHPENSVEE